MARTSSGVSGAGGAMPHQARRWKCSPLTNPQACMPRPVFTIRSIESYLRLRITDHLRQKSRIDCGIPLNDEAIAFAGAGSCDPLLEESTTKICIDQAAFHFSHGTAEITVCACPACASTFESLGPD